jgi:hypothetical protein
MCAQLYGGFLVRVSTSMIAVFAATTLCQMAAFGAPPAKSTAAKAGAAKKAPARPSKASPAAAGHAAAPGATSAVYNTYANQLRAKMATGWQFPSGDNHVTLTVEVGSDGSVSNLSLTSSPKNTEAEQKANDAFNSAQPLQALPSNCSGATITCLFDSKADQWDSHANISVKLDPKTAAAPPAGEAKTDDDASKK